MPFVCPEKLTIIVTQENIDAGMPRDDRSCPIALALNRRFRAGHAGLFDYDGFKLYDSSYRMKRFVRRFDACKPVRPTTFILKRIH